MRPGLCATFIVFQIFLIPAYGKTAEQIFAEVSPSVVMVYSLSADSRAQGSGVVIGPSQVVTNCHVLKNQGVFKVTTDNQSHTYDAILQYADEPRDICQLFVKNLLTAPVAIGTAKSVRVGQRVYAIGSPQGLERTLSDGLVSSIRAVPGGYSLLQITAPITHGSSGGGLFDENGKLIGITTSIIEEGQNLNFALPIDLLANFAARRKTEKDVSRTVAEEVRIFLHHPPPDLSPPKFSDLVGRINYLYWLGEMSERLKNEMPDSKVRLEFLRTAWYEARRAGLDPALVVGVVQVESNFHRFYVSPKGALGYMGVMPHWTKTIGDGDPKKLFHMQTNLRYGCSIMRMYVDMEGGNLFLALGRYKGVSGRPEYPNAVLKAWKRFEYR